MKKTIKIFLVIVLVVILGLEIYLYFFKSSDKQVNDNITNDINQKKGVKIDTKHLADLYTGYNSDNLTYDGVKESDQVYYTTISGLKNKTIENKVNKKIKEKIDKLKVNLDANHSVSNKIVSNFENTLSIGFCINEKDSNGKFYECDEWSSYSDSLNLDLTSGKELKITDVVNTKPVLKKQLLSKAYEDFSKKVGIVCEGGPCEIENPDYSMVEDEQFSIASKFNKEDYYFVFNPKQLQVVFNNTKIKNVQTCWDKTDGCYKAKVGGADTFVKDNYETTYTAKIDLLDLLDNLIIYDKFKTNDTIYEKDSTKIDRKFIFEKTEDDAYESGFIENDKYLVDYSLIDIFDKKFPSKVKESLLKEMITNNDKFTVYDVFGSVQSIGSYDYFVNQGGTTYDYVYYNVYQYDLDKNVFEENKKQIYIDKYSKIDTSEGPSYIYDVKTNSYNTYSYLSNYLTKKKFYYYIYDSNGNRIDTSNILNKDYLSTVIPNEWYSLGKYNNINDMVKNALIINNEEKSYPNNLVIFVSGFDTIKLKYKGNEITLSKNYSEYGNIAKQLYK